MNNPSQELCNRATVIVYTDDHGNRLFFSTYVYGRVYGTPNLEDAKIFGALLLGRNAAKVWLEVLERRGLTPVEIEVIAAI